MWHTVVWAAILVVIPARHAEAYIDPGSGSLVFQFLIAGLLGAVFTVKSWWRGLWNVIARRRTISRSTKSEE